MNILPVSPVHMLSDSPPEKRWLIENLWSYEAVGIIGAEPKCGKSILALSIAVAVASGKPCLGQFNVTVPGRVLLFAAEDPLTVVKKRIAAIALSYNVSLQSLDIFAITQPTLRIDVDTEFQRLKDTIEKLSPRLLILDPFVRLHRVDENSAGDVAPLLSKLRYLQRTFHLSVILVHHARKDSKHTRQGQALRGSSEFHAWGDSNLYLKRKTNDSISLTIEHRAEKSPPSFNLFLSSNEIGPFHQIINSDSDTSADLKQTPEQKIVHLLQSTSSPMNFSLIRSETKLRSQIVSQALNSIVSQGIAAHSKNGYSIVS